MIRTHEISLTVAGSAGSATGIGSTLHPVNGRILAVYVDYTTQPATADLTIATVGNAAPAQPLMTKANSGTDAWYYPRQLLHGTDGAALTAVYDALPVDDYVQASIAQGDPGSVKVYLLVESHR